MPGTFGVFLRLQLGKGEKRALKLISGGAIGRSLPPWRSCDMARRYLGQTRTEFTLGPGMNEEGLSEEELDELLEARVLAYEKEKREEWEKKGKPFLCDVTKESPDPKSFPKTRHKLFGLAPLIGAAVKEHRIAAILRLRAFRSDHEAARLRKKAGEHDVVFPHGTWLAVQRWCVAVEPAPT